ncbi:1-acyl-sn-glycerol-3-phosphate acyltransferase [Nocardioides marmorisolisilvae]|uniref:Glycerol acyltransferase n=1 Tax=Nocardioides marmorisolisilvae TaxID=1542737 RepID=A0A3N0DPL7_9ACTN|nr:1-acyl-sn-glycerol-3-phosphate acyltransferase [Nocardioides marmorisolisilvae]RNL77575.1 glycerol acyltransferase [Nocardioides marmorisolisilvae]
MNETEDFLRAAKGVWDVVATEYLERYHRLDVTIDARIPDEPVMFVCNHGFGGIVDLNVMAFAAALRKTGQDRPVTFLVHQIAWTLGIGKLVEIGGGRKATRAAAEQAIAEGHHIVVFPGGDIDAGKAFKDRNTVTFAGRSGFASLARRLNVPMVPVVTAGAGESLYVHSDGTDLASRFGLDKALRIKALPISVSIPWGISFGVTGLVPYIPLPSKLSTAVLAPVDPTSADTPEALAEHVQASMQRRMDELVASRRPIIG